MGLLRLVFALIVVFEHGSSTHGNLPILDSDGAVLGFFVLSGFYMAMILETRYRTDTRSFYFNRFIRLYPSYLLCLLVSVGFLWGFYLKSGHALGPVDAILTTRLSPAASFFSFITQAAILGQDWSRFFSVSTHGHLALRVLSSGGKSLFSYNFVPQAWTLSIELVFYALSPWILRWKTWSLVGCFLAGLILRILLLNWLGTPDIVGRLLPLELSVFCGGIVAWRIVSRTQFSGGPKLNFLTVGSVGLLLFAGFAWDQKLSRRQLN
jgi:peptidoglycan/LPS O-acetylase OafA/YrhL